MALGTFDWNRPCYPADLKTSRKRLALNPFAEYSSRRSVLLARSSRCLQLSRAGKSGQGAQQHRQAYCTYNNQRYEKH